MEKIKLGDIRTMTNEEIVALSEGLYDEADRRQRIAELEKKANDVIHELIGEMCNCDIVDIIDDYTGEVLVKNYRGADCIEMADYDWSYPRFSVRCGQRSE